MRCISCLFRDTGFGNIRQHALLNIKLTKKASVRFGYVLSVAAKDSSFPPLCFLWRDSVSEWKVFCEICLLNSDQKSY